MNDGRNVEIAFFGGSFTGIDIQLQEQYLHSAYTYIEKGKVSGIRLSTRPDYIDEEILCLLKKYGVTAIELGVQSTCNDILRICNRGCNNNTIRTASKLIKEHDFSLGLQMMIGLPGDSYSTSQKTVDDIIAMGADNTRIYPTLVVRGTELERMYLRGDYTPLELDEAVEWAKTFYLQFEKAGVNVLRVGLHPSPELEQSLCAGPYHRSFKELVMTKIWAGILNSEFFTLCNQRLSALVHPTQINYAFGYEGTNRKWWEKKGLDLKIKCDNSLSKYAIEWQILE